MSTFANYRADAIQAEVDRLRDDGDNSPVMEWMRDDADRYESLREVAEDLAHNVIVARGDNARHEAIDRFHIRMAIWVERYVDSWTDAQRNEFMAEQDDAYLEARSLDRQEGIDA